MFQKNYKWIISTILAAMAILVPIILYILSLSGKSLDFDIVSKYELVSKEYSMSGIEVKIKGERVNTAILYTCRLINSGSKPILKDDFERPIFINFPDSSKIYLAKLTKKIPNNIRIKYQLMNNKLIIEPMLLNPEEEFEVVLVSSTNEYPNIDARIAGISKINNKLPDSKKFIKSSIIFFLVFFLLIFYAKSFNFVAFPRSNYSSKLSRRLTNFLLAVVCGFSAAAILFIEIDKTTIDSHQILFFSLSLIPILIGTIWSQIEEKYNKCYAADS